MRYFLIFTIVLVLFSIFMTLKQNKGSKMGGAISPAKSFWLFYCIYTWFLLMPVTLYLKKIPAPLYHLWLGFVGWMYARGLIEMFMMFVTKNWTPPLGIVHNISCIAWLLFGSAYYYEQVMAVPLIILLFHCSVIFSLVMETYYAIAFYKIVGSKTKGDEAIWYANKDDPEFKKVVKVTFLANIPLYACLIIFTGSLV